jgi:hypothetical protein
MNRSVNIHLQHDSVPVNCNLLFCYRSTSNFRRVPEDFYSNILSRDLAVLGAGCLHSLQILEPTSELIDMFTKRDH